MWVWCILEKMVKICMWFLDASQLKWICGDLISTIFILNVKENIHVQFVFWNRICSVEIFYKLEINFVFQNLCYLFHYLISKILGFGVKFSKLLFSWDKLETFKHACWYGRVLLLLQGCLSVLVFFWKRLWCWLNMEFQRHVAAWKMQCTFWSGGEQMFPFTKIVRKNVNKICMY